MFNTSHDRYHPNPNPNHRLNLQHHLDPHLPTIQHLTTILFFPLFPLLPLFLLPLLTGCGGQHWNKLLPPSIELGSSQGYRTARTIIHLHSPTSYDACTSDQSPCLQSLRSALCSNRVDFAFLTDHLDHMIDHEIPELVLNQSGDTPLLQEDGAVIGNQIQCSEGSTTNTTHTTHTTKIMAGYEDQLMPIGMARQLNIPASERGGQYIQTTQEFVKKLQTESDAIVIIPHTESRTTDLLKTLNMDGIEIYNTHANVNPKIRHDFLGFDYFLGVVDILVYIADPYFKTQPDLAFLSFLKVSPVYAQKWDELLGNGLRPIGVGGNDSHQNFFPGHANDGERVDSHRRLIRWVSNHFLVNTVDLTGIKQAIRAGRGWVVFEGLGSPVGMEFYAKNDTDTILVGSIGPFIPNKTTIRVELPHLHAESPQGSKPPTIRIELKKVDASGTETVVATAQNTSLNYLPDSPGAYRAEVNMVPLHLKEYINFHQTLAETEAKWIITNHIYLE